MSRESRIREGLEELVAAGVVDAYHHEAIGWFVLATYGVMNLLTPDETEAYIAGAQAGLKRVAP